MPSFDKLDRGDRRTYFRQVADGAPRSTVIRILDFDHRLISEIPNRLLGGQTDITRVRLADAADVTTRVFSATFVDPTRSMVWDPDSPSLLALWPNRMLQVRDGFLIDGLGLVSHTDFTGPLAGPQAYTRKGAEAGVTCWGKEYLAQRELGETRKFAEGTKVLHVMRELMEAVGETKFDFPEMDDELPNRLVVPATANVWLRFQRLARTIDVQGFYPGPGRCTVRRLPGNPSMRWEVGDGLVVGEPKVTFGLSEGFANDFSNTGRRLPGRQRRARGRWRPGPEHPLSGQAFERGGEPQFWRSRAHNPKVATDAAAERRAKERGKRRIRQASDATFDVRAGVLELVEGDQHTVAGDDFGRAVFRVREGSIGYGSGSAETSMSINRVRRMSNGAHVR